MFVWSERYDTKIDILDIEHKNLFNLLNKLIIKVERSEICNEDVEDCISLLVHYSKTHFHHEEILMREYHIDFKHLSMHLMEHESFSYDVHRLCNISSEYDRRILGKVHKLVSFMSYWLTFHILGTDKVMAKQIEKIKAGITPQEAFEISKEQKIDPVTVNIIMDSVIGLWLDSKEICVQMKSKSLEYERKIARLEKELQQFRVQQSD